MHFNMTPCYAVFHKIADCYHQATLSCRMLSCKDVICYKFLRNCQQLLYRLLLCVYYNTFSTSCQELFQCRCICGGLIQKSSCALIYVFIIAGNQYPVNLTGLCNTCVCCWSCQQESNLHLSLRRTLYYPLYYSKKLGAFDWTRTSTPFSTSTSTMRVYQFHHKGSIGFPRDPLSFLRTRRLVSIKRVYATWYNSTGVSCSRNRALEYQGLISSSISETWYLVLDSNQHRSPCKGDV